MSACIQLGWAGGSMLAVGSVAGGCLARKNATHGWALAGFVRHAFCSPAVATTHFTLLDV